MAVKMTGAEYKSFMNAPIWGEDGWYEDAVLTVNGEINEEGVDLEELPDTAVVKIEGGYVFDLPKGREMSLEGLSRSGVGPGIA